MNHPILLSVRASLLALVGLCFLFAAAVPAEAQFTIENPSFEEPAFASGYTYDFPGWMYSAGTSVFVERIDGFAADGNQHLGMEEGYAVWQWPGVTFQSNQVYRLRVAVGNRPGWTDAENSSQYEILAADDPRIRHPLGTYNASVLPPGSFRERELMLDTFDYPELVGHFISVQLRAGGTGRSHFDNVRLDSNVHLVVNTNDSGPGSLRQAVLDSGTFEFPETIRFDPSLSGQTITLTSGQIVIDKRLTIETTGLPGGITVSGNGAGRIFLVGAGPGVSLDLRGLTLTRGRAFGSDGHYGGAIVVSPLGSLHLNGCTLAGNSARYGGAITAHTDASVFLYSCTLTGNSADNGGALYNSSQYEPELKDCTIVGNTAVVAGGGIYAEAYGVSVNNCIVAGNTPDDIYLNISGGNVTRTGANIIQSLSGTSSGPAAINAAPNLAPLGNYGGPTPTMPPLPGSPAINAGVSSTLPTDQRGFARVVGSALDIGAVEGPVVLITDSSYDPASRQIRLIWTSNPGDVFSLHYSANLTAAGGGFSPLPGNINSGGESTTKTVTLPAGPGGFLRVQRVSP